MPDSHQLGPGVTALYTPAVPTRRSVEGVESHDARAARAGVLAGERERIAAELNALVITRAFRIGLQLASLVDAHSGLASELYPLIEETDALIRDVRSIAFDVRRAS